MLQLRKEVNRMKDGSLFIYEYLISEMDEAINWKYRKYNPKVTPKIKDWYFLRFERYGQAYASIHFLTFYYYFETHFIKYIIILANK